MTVPCLCQAVEFSLDNAPELQRAGFALDGPKGALERGQLKRIGVSWVPPADLQVRHGPGAAPSSWRVSHRGPVGVSHRAPVGR